MLQTLLLQNLPFKKVPFQTLPFKNLPFPLKSQQLQFPNEQKPFSVRWIKGNISFGETHFPDLLLKPKHARNRGTPLQYRRPPNTVMGSVMRR